MLLAADPRFSLDNIYWYDYDEGASGASHTITLAWNTINVSANRAWLYTLSINGESATIGVYASILNGATVKNMTKSFYEPKHINFGIPIPLTRAGGAIVILLESTGGSLVMGASFGLLWSR